MTNIKMAGGNYRKALFRAAIRLQEAGQLALSCSKEKIRVHCNPAWKCGDFIAGIIVRGVGGKLLKLLRVTARYKQTSD